MDLFNSQKVNKIEKEMRSLFEKIQDQHHMIYELNLKFENYRNDIEEYIEKIEDQIDRFPVSKKNIKKTTTENKEILKVK